MPRFANVLVIGAIAGMSLAACTAAPRVRNVEGGPVNTGPGSVEAARRQLLGTWALVSYDVVNANGSSTRVPAQAQLTYDEFGNLKVAGTLTDAAARATGSDALLSYSGRAVIDPGKQEMRLLDLQGSGGLASETVVNVNAVRRYEIKGDTLEIDQRDASGRTTAKATWKRVKT